MSATFLIGELSSAWPHYRLLLDSHLRGFTPGCQALSCRRPVGHLLCYAQ